MSVTTLVGLLILALGVDAARFLWRGFQSGRLGRGWKTVEAIVLVCGICLGVAAVAHSHYPTPDKRLVGFPFLAAVFERTPSGAWADYVGPITLPATIGNFAVGLLLPHLPLATWLWFGLKRRSVIW